MFLMPMVADKGGWKHVKAAESGVNIRESIYLVTYLRRSRVLRGEDWKVELLVI